MIRKRLIANEPLAVLYIDLANFKEYNDEYGWVKGDKIIKMLARQTIDAVRAQGNAEDFIGHVGGDDFIVLSTPARAEAIARLVISRFDVEIPLFYPEQVRAVDISKRLTGAANSSAHPLLLSRLLL